MRCLKLKTNHRAKPSRLERRGEMREIKFRAWDKERKKMFCPVGLFWNRVTHGLFDYCKDENETRIAINICSISEQPTLCPFIIMQYTGLKDKGGKEIFEGDILKIKAVDNRWNISVVKYGIARREMKSGWTVDIPCFYFDLVGADFKAFPIVKNYKGKHDLTMLEVIGNLYEHPELLEAKGKE